MKIISKEKLITTYEEYKKSNGNDMVKGLGRLMAYQGLDYIEKFLENDEIYSEKLEDSIVGIESYLISKEKQLDQLTNNWNELEEWLKSYIALIENPDTFEEQTLEDLKEVLDKVTEIKERKNERRFTKDN